MLFSDLTIQTPKKLAHWMGKESSATVITMNCCFWCVVLSILWWCNTDKICM